ncbi:GTP-binding protein Era [Labedella gwakjiensis]|uniref:GTPase Era n=1 Tax=Labedella gwakjiensis TaxID=390269 RepID=A0A2P8H073_9MICO|nr:GTPase Era [Labedella gwakjiensis]PSL39624.1 GTP-binding protein Era [Labedella gwakjiensis]RUQ85986.1 GTPase Era [Labedella gwakjiensis]
MTNEHSEHDAEAPVGSTQPSSDASPDTDAANAGPAYRAGFVSFVGRPNVGKSTLTNALVGEKVAITSSKPQTTRRAIRGVVHRPDGQIVIVDTPGIHRPRTLLGQRLNDLVEATLGDVDVIGLCIPADEKIGPGDRFINEQLDRYGRAKKIAIVTKIDDVPRDKVGDQLIAVSQLREWDSIVPVSSTESIQLDVLADEILALLPPSVALYPAEAVTEETLEDRVAELIREAALEGVTDELPHSLAVTIDDIQRREDKDIVEIYANVFVERDSQKAIIIGKGGSRLKDVGSRARAEIEPLVGSPVFLSLRVKVAKEWQRDPKQLRRLGF